MFTVEYKKSRKVPKIYFTKNYKSWAITVY
uniref:Uncharacterized protein n=1 Tax=Anguilla anguilla TaxID=7936 RepID=A0A0E9VCY2_ANGAN